MDYSGQSHISEIEMLMKELNYKKSQLDKEIDETVKKYPQIETKKDAIYLIAKERELQFKYGDNGKCNGLQKIDPDLDLDISNYLD